MRRSILYLCWLLLAGINLSASPLFFPWPVFTTYTQADGLASSAVQAIVRDARGYLWVGTPSGLCRFNGTRFEKITLLDAATRRPSEQDIQRLQLDGAQNLWVLLPNELGYVNTSTLKYNRAKIGHFTAIGLSTKQQTVLLGLDSLFVFNHQGKMAEARPFRNAAISSTATKSLQFDGLFSGTKNQLWATQANALFIVNEYWQFSHCISIPQADQPEAVTIRDLLEYAPDKIFLASYGRGVMVYNPQENTLQTLPGFTGRTTCKSLTIWKDVTGKKWLLAAADRKWQIIDPETLNFKTFEYSPGDLNAFPFANQSLVLYTDQQGIAWTGNEDGLAALQPFRQLMHRLQFNSALQWGGKSIFDGIPFSLLQTPEGFRVGGWYSKGWHWFTKNWNYIKSVQQVHGSKSLLWQGVYGQYYAGNGNYWLSTDSGLVHWNNGKSEVYLPQGLKETDEFIFRKISPLSKNQLLITSRKGLYYFDINKRIFSQSFKATSGNICGLPDAAIADCWLATNGSLYVTTRLGVYLKKENEQKFSLLASLDNGAPTNTYLGITEDANGDMYFGSFNGLLLAKNNGASISYETNTPSAKIFKLLSDKQNRIWAISTNGLLCRLAPNQWLQFTSANSGWPWDYTDGYFEKDNAGRMYAGANKWHIDFDPEQLIDQLPQAQIAVEGAMLDNSLIQQNNHQITMPAGTSMFSVLVNDLNLNGQAGNTLLYRFKNGTSTEWQPVANNRILFANLRPGKYKVEVKGSPQWNRKDSSYSFVIVVLPKWYQTLWFYILCIAVTIGFVIWLIRFLLARQRLAGQYDKQLKEAQMQALRTQMNPHFIFNSLNSINSFILDKKTDEASEYLTTFGKLLRTTLELTRSNSVKLNRELDALQLYIEMEMTRVSNFDYELHINSNIQSEHIEVPPLILQPFVENAIWHGLSNKQQMGLLSVNIEMPTENILHITIADDGIGRAQAAGIKKAFKAHKSFGIDITKNRLKLQHPENQVNIEDLYLNEAPAGTRIHILIHLA